MFRRGKKKLKITKDEAFLSAVVRGDVDQVTATCKANRSKVVNEVIPWIDSVFDKAHRSPLVLASAMGNADMVRVLLKKKIDIDAQDEDGNTALFHAGAHGHLAVVKLLLAKGCDTSLANAAGQRPYDLVEVVPCLSNKPDCDTADCEYHSAKAEVKELLETMCK